MKKIILTLTILFVLITGCKNHENNTSSLASKSELEIINQMDCWKSSIEDAIGNAIAFGDKEKSSGYVDNLLEANKEACEYGRERLSNDSVFITCIRDEKKKDELLEKRKKSASELQKLKKIMPFFNDNLEIILQNNLEYKYYDGSTLGLFLEPYKKETFLSTKEFYNNISEVFKEYYIGADSNITDESLITINNLLKEIEEIDKHLWALKYYYEKESEYKKSKSIDEIKRLKKEKIDSLIK